jgi:hypothetical protein
MASSAGFRKGQADGEPTDRRAQRTRGRRRPYADRLAQRAACGAGDRHADPEHAASADGAFGDAAYAECALPASALTVALSYVYKASVATGPLRHPSGRTYALNGTGVATIAAPDGADGTIGLQATLLYVTGATADRPSPSQSNAPRPGTAFLDTSLSEFVFYAGAVSSTGWCDQNGNPV